MSRKKFVKLRKKSPTKSRSSKHCLEIGTAKAKHPDSIWNDTLQIRRSNAASNFSHTAHFVLHPLCGRDIRKWSHDKDAVQKHPTEDTCSLSTTIRTRTPELCISIRASRISLHVIVKIATSSVLRAFFKVSINFAANTSRFFAKQTELSVFFY